MHEPAGAGRVGTLLGHFRLLEAIGSGGMGVVYKAEDVRLHRPVAVKLLPDEIARDDAAIARFRREAEAASALNHPGICTVYDIGEADGVAFLVMEYLDGLPLDVVIKRGPLPVAQVLSIGRDVADALDAAHRAGVLHRDVKPGNIFVTARGQAKLLDFGVARIDRQAVGDLPTAAALTVAGTTVGTVAYMSPEQVRGQDVDGRSDLFSLGAVLYEMATGERAFRGETPGLLFDAILNRVIPPASRARPVPAELDRVIARALEKDRDLRYQTAADLRADLARLSRNDAPAAPRPIRRIGAVAVLVTVVAAAGLWRWLRAPDAGAFSQYTIEQVTNSGTAGAAAVSPDGRFIANVQTAGGLRSLWLRNVRTGSDTQIAAARAVAYTNLTFSPDGDYLYMLRSDGQTTNLLNLIRQPVLGGDAQLLVRDVDTNVTFSPSGDRIAYARANFPAVGQVSWLVANADGSSEQTLLTRPLAAIYSAAPAWSPDGRRIAYTEVSTADALGRLSVFDLQTRQSQAVFSSDDIQTYSPVWAADGRALFVQYATRRTAFTQHQIGLVAYPSGRFTTITNDTNDYGAPRLSSDRRTLVTVQRRSEDRLELVDAGHPGSVGSEVFVSRTPLTAPRWTRSGELVFAVGNRIVARRPDGGERTIFTTDVNAPPGGLSVCQRSGAVVFHWLFHEPRSVRQLWRVNADGGGAVRLPEAGGLGIPECSPDERWIAFEARSGIMRVPASPNGTPEQLADLIPVSNLAYSPDGRTLVAITLDRVVSDNHAARRALVLLVPGVKPRLMDVNQEFAGGAVHFMADGVSVAYVVKDGSREALWSQPLDGGRGGAIGQLAPGGHVAAFEWSPDGRSIVLLRRSAEADVVLLTDTRR